MNKLSIDEILDSVLSPNSHKNYNSQIKKFKTYLESNSQPLVSSNYGSLVDNLVDFFHTVVGTGLGTSSVDSAKSATVWLYKKLKVKPNPAQDDRCKDYVKGLKKYVKSNNLEEHISAHPLELYELRLLIEGLNDLPLFSKLYYQLLFVLCFLSCFRISECLNLRGSDVSIHKDSNEREYLAVRLNWHKTATVNMESQIYHLYNEMGEQTLSIVQLYKDFQHAVFYSGCRIETSNAVFCRFQYQSSSGNCI
jgi:site-specific recombinase XerD